MWFCTVRFDVFFFSIRGAMGTEYENHEMGEDRFNYTFFYRLGKECSFFAGRVNHVFINLSISDK